MIHNGSCLKEEKFMWFEILRLGVDRFTSLPVV